MTKSKLTRIVSVLLVVVALLTMPLSVYATDMSNYGNAYDLDDSGNEIKIITSIQANIHFDVDYFMSVHSTGYFKYTDAGTQVSKMDMEITVTARGESVELTRTDTSEDQAIGVGFRTNKLTFEETDAITEIIGEYVFYSRELQRYVSTQGTYLNAADYS